MKKALLFILLLLPVAVACKKDGKKPVATPETAEAGDEPATDDKVEATARVSCETIMTRHSRCLFRIPETEKIFNIPVADSPKKGAKEPLVTLVEFSEFQCPGCKGFSLRLIPELLKKYDGKLQVVFKHYPLDFHELAFPAALVSEEVRVQKGEEAFWKFHDMLFNEQEKLSEEFLLESAKKLGVDMEKLRKVMTEENNPNRARINRDMELGNKVGVDGTPSLYINGVRFSHDTDDLVELIDHALAKAEKAVESGTPRARVYTYLVDHGTLVFETPIPKETQERMLKEKEKFFVEKCNTPQAQESPFMQYLSQCSQPEIPCDALIQCVESKVRQHGDLD